MKILIISDAWHPQVNGVVKTYENLGHELISMGHQLQIISPQNFPIRVPLPFYPEIQVPFFTSRQLELKIDSFSPDHIHIATEGVLGWAGRKICMNNRIPFTTCYHTSFPDYICVRLAPPFDVLKNPLNALSYKILRKFHNSAHCTFVVSDYLATHLKNNGFTGKLQRMTRGINPDTFHGGPKTLFEHLKRPIALYAGRIAPEKNIEAFLSMPWIGSKVLVGDGPSRRSLQKKYPDAIFLGTKNEQELSDCYRSADIFVFPSMTDTFGLVTIEAMACGLPIAAHPTQSLPEIVTSPELGCLDNNLEKATKAAIFSTGTADFRQNHAKKVYSWEKAATEFLSALPNYG